MAEYQSNWEASEPDHVDFLLKESSDHLKINPAQERASIIENPSEQGTTDKVFFISADTDIHR